MDVEAEEGDERDPALPVPFERASTGRPRSVIGYDLDAQEEFYSRVLDYRREGVKWSLIHQLMGVNRSFMDRWRAEVQFVDPFRMTELTDAELFQKVQTLMLQFSQDERGIRMIQTFFRSQNIYVSRERMRLAVSLANGPNHQRRRGYCVRRRVYNVPGPHHLWHVDGNHKLIHFNLVVHAGVDGFSRALVYARCSDNNRADTALAAFQEGVAHYGCPSRCRSDRGGENVRISDFMIENRGMNRNSMIVGKSTHNQRIERMWRDIFKEVLSAFYDLFYHFEHVYHINFSNAINVFCLHFVFLPRINMELQLFILRWNTHPLSTERHFTPNQLLLLNENLSAAVEVDDLFGAEGEINQDDDDDANFENVVLESIACPLTDEQMALFRERVQPVELDEINLNAMWDVRFLEAIEICHEILEQV